MRMHGRNPVDDTRVADAVAECLKYALTSGDWSVDPIDRDTVLVGRDSIIDSVSMVTFIVGLEEALERLFGRPVVLTEDPDVFGDDGPFSTVGSLIRYIQGMTAQS